MSRKLESNGGRGRVVTSRTNRPPLTSLIYIVVFLGQRLMIPTTLIVDQMSSESHSSSPVLVSRLHGGHIQFGLPYLSLRVHLKTTHTLGGFVVVCIHPEASQSFGKQFFTLAFAFKNLSMRALKVPKVVHLIRGPGPSPPPHKNEHYKRPLPSIGQHESQARNKPSPR